MVEARVLQCRDLFKQILREPERMFEFLSIDLKAQCERGQEAGEVELGILDGLPGLEQVFEDEFLRAKIQRCQVHVARNVRAKGVRSHKHEMADRLRDIFYAGNRSLAWAAYQRFLDQYSAEFPSAVQSVERSIDESADNECD